MAAVTYHMPQGNAIVATYRARNRALVLHVFYRASSCVTLQIIVHATLPLHAHVRRAVLARRLEVARSVAVVGEGDDVGAVAGDWVSVSAAVAAPLAAFAQFGH
eukprot:3657533-Pleurochrysis_carterae.AAC.3